MSLQDFVWLYHQHRDGVSRQTSLKILRPLSRHDKTFLGKSTEMDNLRLGMVFSDGTLSNQEGQKLLLLEWGLVVL